MPKPSFNLEEKIADWRKQMAAAGVGGADALDELESHLREDFQTLVAAGKPQAEAFDRALARMGTPTDVQREFEKLAAGETRLLRIATIFWAGAAVAMTSGLIAGFVLSHGKPGLILGLHILTVLLGYGTALLMGLGAICQLFRRRLRSRLALGTRLFARLAQRFGLVTAAFVMQGTVLGMFVSRDLFGNYWNWDPKEIGALCVIAWFAALAAMQRRGPLRVRSAILMCIAGNIIVLLAWFGAGIMVYNARGLGRISYGPLAVCVGVHLCFLALAAAREEEAAFQK